MKTIKGKPPKALDTPTPGCACSRCRRLKEIQANGPPDTKKQAGRVQQSAIELGWQDSGSEDPREGKLYGYMRPAERADREEREATGRTLPSCYKHIIGERPVMKFGDRQAAKLYLLRIVRAMDEGGWTRGEWTRLYKLRRKWQARAEGNDPRFNEVGNRQGGLCEREASMVKHRKLIQGMKEILDKSGRSNGD